MRSFLLVNFWTHTCLSDCPGTIKHCPGLGPGGPGLGYATDCDGLTCEICSWSVTDRFFQNSSFTLTRAAASNKINWMWCKGQRGGKEHSTDSIVTAVIAVSQWSKLPKGCSQQSELQVIQKILKYGQVAVWNGLQSEWRAQRSIAKN